MRRPFLSFTLLIWSIFGFTGLSSAQNSNYGREIMDRQSRAFECSQGGGLWRNGYCDYSGKSSTNTNQINRMVGIGMSNYCRYPIITVFSVADKSGSFQNFTHRFDAVSGGMMNRNGTHHHASQGRSDLYHNTGYTVYVAIFGPNGEIVLDGNGLIRSDQDPNKFHQFSEYLNVVNKNVKLVGFNPNRALEANSETQYGSTSLSLGRSVTDGSLVFDFHC